MKSDYFKLALYGPLKGVISRYHRAFLKGQYPSFLLINVTERCNCRCALCRIWDKKNVREPSIAEYERLFRDALWKNIRTLSLTGGEPFLRKDLKDVIFTAAAHLKNLRRISLPSNGMTTAHIVETVKEILAGTPRHIDFKVGISLDGDAEIHDRMRGVPGVFKKAVETIRQLRSITDERFETGILSLLCEQNAERLEEIHGLLTSLAPSITWTLATESAFFDNKEKENGLYPPETVKRIISFIDDVLTPSGPEKAYLYSLYKDHLIRKRRSYPCLAGYLSAYIDNEGNLLPCHYIGKGFIFGNFLESGESLEKMWFSRKGGDIRKRLRRYAYCRNCSNNCDFRNLIQEDFWSFLSYHARHPTIPFKALFHSK